MRYLALAVDYDGTIAREGFVAEATWSALDRLRSSGRKLILVTGRELDDLLQILPRADRFDRIVAENGAVMYYPDTRTERILTEPPSVAFVEELHRRGVAPLSVGRSIVATVREHGGNVLDAISAAGVEWHVIFNKGSAMALPSGVTKATGLAPTLAELGIPPEHVVGVGDAENDHAFLTLCGCAVAVANALPALKERADWVTPGPDGVGVAQLIDRLLTDDLRGVGRAVEASATGDQVATG